MPATRPSCAAPIDDASSHRPAARNSLAATSTPVLLPVRLTTDSGFDLSTPVSASKASLLRVGLCGLVFCGSERCQNGMRLGVARPGWVVWVLGGAGGGRRRRRRVRCGGGPRIVWARAPFGHPPEVEPCDDADGARHEAHAHASGEQARFPKRRRRADLPGRMGGVTARARPGRCHMAGVASACGARPQPCASRPGRLAASSSSTMQRAQTHAHTQRHAWRMPGRPPARARCRLSTWAA